MWEPDVDGHTVRLGGTTDGSITFGEPVVGSTDAGYMGVPMRIDGPGLSAQTTLELHGWGGWTVGFLAYFADMAASWRGWTGAKDWHDDGWIVQLNATHDGIRIIKFAVSTTPLPGSNQLGSWKVDTVIAVEPGSLEATAAALRDLFAASSDTTQR